MKKLTPADVTQEVKDAVAKLLALTAVAQVIRERVDVVQRRVLADVPMYNDIDFQHGHGTHERITDPGHTYLSKDDVAFDAYLTQVDAIEKANGLKPADMDRDHCPALMAERQKTEAEWELLDAAAVMLDIPLEPGETLNDRLLCRKNGLEFRQEFINTLVGLVVILPA